MDMDLDHLRYFSAAVRHGSFGAAARALRITQPDLTKAVRQDACE
jgi:DNA-binding transcriptional LysR family regulator